MNEILQHETAAIFCQEGGKPPFYTVGVRMITEESTDIKIEREDSLTDMNYMHFPISEPHQPYTRMKALDLKPSK